jgi:serine/threonine protein kinase
MKCPYCGTSNNYGENFCEECGAQLISGDSVDTSTEAVEPLGQVVSGTRLQNGRYVIIKMLGEGGMGSVLLAKDTRLADKLMVIKVLSVASSTPNKLEEDVRNFKREAETLAHLDHPLIPDVTDHFEEGTSYYMVMDYVDGENLEDWLERTKQPMQERDALKYTLEVLDILEYLSQQQPAIVHRDIKPANIIISSKDKHAHLVDFGIARSNTLINGERKKTTALGTPGYAPPEQYQGFSDPRSDLYALAATLHHLVTNRDPADYPPFQYPAARTLNPHVSSQLEQILLKALKPSANERYQSAQEMRADLESLLAGTYVLDTTDSYRLSDTTRSRTLPSQPTRTKTASSFDSSKGSAESLAAAGERIRQQQQQQMETPVYSSPDYYQEPPRSRPGPSFQQPRPLRSYMQPPRQANSFNNYRQNQSPVDDNVLMRNFIIFIVAICIIGILAYLLFNSIPI